MTESIKIKLKESSWFYYPNNRLGKPGGFGEVFLGKSPDGEIVAVKKLFLNSGTGKEREFEIAEILINKGEFDHVISIKDYGIDRSSESYFIIMEKADHSLQDEIDSNRFLSDEKEIINILKDIALGLSEIPMIVHRDLKPPNILFHGKCWKISDFGIARFIEKSTSINTMKNCLSPHYAAPEQWRYERASKATDIYAFGCIAYALFTGTPPYDAKNRDELRNKHLNETPPNIDCSPKLSQLIQSCIMKNPKSRPSIQEVISQLRNMYTDDNSNNSLLAEASAIVAQEKAEKEAEQTRQNKNRDSRKEAAKDGIFKYDDIIETLFDNILRSAPNATRIAETVNLGKGTLGLHLAFPYLQPESFKQSGWNILAGAIIYITQDFDQYPERSANLWYGDILGNGHFGWWEVQYFRPFDTGADRPEPYGINSEDGIRDADYAASNIIHSVAHAAKPVQIEGGYLSNFIQRWSNRLAKASRNMLRHPAYLPEDYSD